uniref:Uncharacterized protein n=1 Tax=Davidia involucrata TaxID=16924 RepID=A0A5B6ZP58_DAVIN
MVQLTLQTKHVPGKNFSCLFRVLGLVRLHFFIELDWNFLPFYILNAYFKLLLGIFQVAFNPITVNSIKKMLSKICREEQCKLTADQIDLIAKSSGGDIRQAITSLQYFCLKSRPKLYAFPTVLPLIQKKDHMGSIVWMMGFLYHLAEMKLFLYFCTTRGRLRILLHWVCTDGTHNFRY